MSERVTGLPSELARAPMRTIRARDVTVYARPRPQLARLSRVGLLHRVADGYFVVVPPDRVGSAWRPSLEAAAAGIAAADFGTRNFALMGISAARMHHAVPRAIGVALVGSPRRRRAIELDDRTATVRFLPRDIEAVSVELMTTELGSCLVTTPEQTLLDLAHRPDADGLPLETGEAMRALARTCDPALLDDIAARQRLGRALARVKAAGML